MNSMREDGIVVLAFGILMGIAIGVWATSELVRVEIEEVYVSERIDKCKAEGGEYRLSLTEDYSRETCEVKAKEINLD